MSASSATPWDTVITNCGSASNAIIVAPYIKAGVLAQVLDRLAPGATVVCVSRWTPQDILAGTTDLDCRTLTLARNGHFLLHNGLHAKYYRFDDRVLIGSANLTGAGMNLTGHGNLEILCPAPPHFDSERFELKLLGGAYSISDTEFALWSQIDSKRTTGNNPTVDAPLGLESWKPTTRRAEYIWLVYQRQSDLIPSDEQRRFAETEAALLSAPPGLTQTEFANWVNLSLRASPFVSDVIATSHQARETAWDIISEQWNMSKHDAAQSISTAEDWINYFEFNLITGR